MKHALYLGDGPVTGPACYLRGILKAAGFTVDHEFQKFPEKLLHKKHSLVIFSDYSRKNLSRDAERAIQKKVSEGAGFLMIGGWGSFTGKDGNYHGSLIEKMLPVSCLSHDDRRNLASGANFNLKKKHSVVKGLSLKPSPVLIGYNVVRQKPKTNLILELRENASGKKNPLLVLGTYGRAQTAAFATDVAPHWCGGLVDWGAKRRKIQVTDQVRIEVGNEYVRFLSQLLNWLNRKS